MSRWRWWICSGNSNWLVPNLGISLHSRQRHSPSFEPASTGSSILCSPLNMRWRCSAGRCRLGLHAVASTDSPTASPRSLPKRANSAHPENGQRLAGYVGYSEVGSHLPRMTPHLSLALIGNDSAQGGGAWERQDVGGPRRFR